MPTQKEGMTLQKLVALLENPDFIAAGHAYHNQLRTLSLETAQSKEEWERRAPAFMSNVLDPFIENWGAYPPDIELLVSPLRYRKYSARMTGLWGIIPVYPWTTRQEIERQRRQIHRAIGKTHQDFMGNRDALIAKWLSLSHISSSTGKPPRSSDIAAVVWGQKKGLKRPSKAQRIAKMSFEREQELMKRHTDKGKTYLEAEQLVYQQVRGKEAPASARVRMALRRIKQDHAELENENRDPKKTDKLGFALTKLLRLILLSPSSPPDFETVYAKAAELGNLLTES